MASDGWNQEARAPTKLDGLIGRRIAMGRKVRGMSQESLAKALGITFQQIQKYEQARNRVSASRLYEIARILDLPYAYFFGGKEFGTGQIPDGLDKETLAILKAVTPLGPAQKKAIRSLITQLAKAA